MTTFIPIKSLNKAYNSKKYSNYTLFSRREKEYLSQIKSKNNSNNISSIQRPYSASIKKIPISTTPKKQNNNKPTKSKVSTKFSANRSSITSKKSSKSSSIKKRFYIEDYFHRNNKSKVTQANIMESILNLEKYYTPNTSFSNKYLKSNKNSKININTNNYFNDINYINQVY